MTFNSHRKATFPTPQRFNEYLNGLREEFNLQLTASSTKSSSGRCFNIYLGNLKGEFELMALEVESLWKERDEIEAKVKAQAKELLDVRRNFICERCSKGNASAVRAPSSQAKAMKITSSLFSKPFFQFSSLSNLTTTRDIGLQQSGNIGKKPHFVITPALPSQSVSHATTQASDIIFAHSQTLALPSSGKQAPALTVDPDQSLAGRQCLIQFNDEVVKELDVSTAHVLLHEDTIGCLKFSQDGKYLAVGCRNGKAYIYDVLTGALSRVVKNGFVEDDRVDGVCFVCDGSFLATSSLDGNIYIWEWITKYVQNAFKGHTNTVISLDLSLNGRFLVSAGHDNTVRLWNMRDGAGRLLVEDNPTSIDGPYYTTALFSPDGKFIAASHRDGVIRIWEVRTGHLIRRVRGEREWVFDVMFTANGKGLVSVNLDLILRYWDISSLHNPRCRARSQEVEEQTQPEREVKGHKFAVYSLATSSDGRWLASGSYDQTVRIWDAHNAVMQCTLDDDREEVWRIGFSPAGGYLASGGRNGTVRIWRYSKISPDGGQIQQG